MDYVFLYLFLFPSAVETSVILDSYLNDVEVFVAISALPFGGSFLLNIHKLPDTQINFCCAQ